ncbi:MAG: S-methyl-5-thioribose-1-phosphate isomerase [Candidatus Heimdallarchaeota archaeon]|nr:S-methyl-5-thioribose-1-phosphate isomerase [Candidatus Heimdallarchaeota archaeon]
MKNGSINTKTVELIKINNIYSLKLIDQTKLPHTLKYFTTSSYIQGITAIKEMIVRGAPAIGCTGVITLILGIQELVLNQEFSIPRILEIKKNIIEARPTAKDLESFVERFIAQINLNVINMEEYVKIANDLIGESENECMLIGQQSKHLISENMGILTHCNAGALATVDFGTALSPMRFANSENIKFKVFVNETRPRMQGLLTAWELYNEDIDFEYIVDNAAGFYMYLGKINLVIVGCDRVLKDGSVANKIGTLEKAVLAKAFGIPFYVAMPWSTFEPNLENASQIPIEYRNTKEIKTIGNCNNIVPDFYPTSNPAFDITPPEYITGFITKDGIIQDHELYDKFLKLNYKTS